MSESMTFRCPDDLADFIKSQALEHSSDKTSVIISMLRQALQLSTVEQGNDADDSKEPLDSCLTEEEELLDKRITEKIEEKLEEKLEALQAQIEELRGKFKAR